MIVFSLKDVAQSLADRFEQQVNRYPDSLAIKAENRELTYDVLNRAANRLTRTILTQSGPDQSPVLLLLDPGTSIIVAMLAVLKAGKIWVPLSPLHPQARLVEIWQRSQATVILTDNSNLEIAVQLAHNKKEIINLDEINDTMADDNLGLVISPDSPACILYTSGSTGHPKGVAHSHRNLLHTIMQYTNSLYLSPADRMSLLPSSSHMAGVNSIFRALLNGAVLLPYDVRKKGLTNLAQWLIREEVSIYNSAPTLFRHFVETLSGHEHFSKLRLIILGGERVYKHDVALFKKHFAPGCILLNNLGCTELSSYRQYFIDHHTQLDDHLVPVGYPVDDREMLLLDETGREVESGQVGEIAVKSPYLALGYWNEPELTRKFFQTNPADETERIYHTGDLGRLRPDGCLLYLGRKDWRVKVRGYRVEVAEVEMSLLEHFAVKEAVVMPWDDGLGVQQLVAYLVPRQSSALTINDLRQYLQSKLPRYMVPSIFMLLDRLPLTSNGKVHREMLPAPDHHRPDLSADFVGPRDCLEQELAEIWQAVLQVETIGVQDNFFDLGGHSLAALRVFAQIEKMVGKNLPVTTLSLAPTIAELANVIRREDASGYTSSLIPLQTAGSHPPLFCVPGNLGNVFTDLGYLAWHMKPDQPFYGLQDNAQNPAQIERLAARYVEHIREIQPAGPYFIGGICAGGVVAFEMAQQLQQQGEQIALLALIEPSPPRGPGLSAYTDFTWLLLRRLFRRLGYHWRNISNLEFTEQRTYAHLKTKLMANSWALRVYDPQPYPGHLDLFLTAASLQITKNPQFGWRNLAAGGITVHEIPGHHNTITGNNNVAIEESYMRVLAGKLKKLVDLRLADG